MEEPQKTYCPSCMEDRDLLDTECVRIPSATGTQEAAKGVCAVCGAAVVSIISGEAH